MRKAQVPIVGGGVIMTTLAPQVKGPISIEILAARVCFTSEFFGQSRNSEMGQLAQLRRSTKALIEPLWLRILRHHFDDSRSVDVRDDMFPSRNREEDCHVQLTSPYRECRWVTLTVFRALLTIAV